MKRSLPFMMLLLGLQGGFVFAQEEMKRCGTTEYMDRLKAEDSNLEAQLLQNEVLIQNYIKQHANSTTADAVITIPVVFHILYNLTVQNISQNRINDQMLVLNKDYAHINSDTINTPAAFKSLGGNTNVQFCLAQRDPNGNATNGVIRKQVTATGFDPINDNNVKYSSLGGDDAWPRAQYLNIWVCNFTGSSSSLLGISTFPGVAAAVDGCVVRFTTVGGRTFQGTQANYNLGRTLTHEIGHWLNLHHIWGDANCGNDYVNDTPIQQTSNYGCPTFPHVTCTNGPDGDLFSNYMDYVNDNCMNLFTQGQGTRVYSTLTTLRLTIPSSNGCAAVSGIDELSQKLPVSVFPNPTTGKFTIQCQLDSRTDVIIAVTNMLGEIVFTKNLKSVTELNLDVDLSENAKGIYNVTVRTAKGIATKKVALYN